jgi:group I intron endonuclease
MIIYTLTNKTNGKQYVGKTMLTAVKRFQQHKSEVRKGSETSIHRAIRKYGPEAFLLETVDTAFTKEELNQKEREWIAKLGTFGVYNMTPGGEGTGHKHSDETKQKLRERRIAYYENNPEARQQAAEWAVKAKLSDEGREKKRQRMKGNSHSKGMTYQHTDEAKRAIKRANSGKVLSQETKAKIAAARKRETLNRNEAGQFIAGPRKP